ncbi:hypothetical protein ET445_02165 [Agromyces protaetiae]|uniref:Uncharacterized protein n=1 Tax=Agromyces protaetiae TaxID=2509455 RepID=A0A4P6FD82_9MICO|nr:hypothetical protein [Agromyces protaetiae]QAY72319.1 hypothetical protein ET445_02165 [Agromyces protaetiae]
MIKLPLPEPLPLEVPLRTLDERRVSIAEFPYRRLRLTIDHEPLVGVTPEMLLWWFGHIGESMEYHGSVQPRYRVWHPLDHVHWGLVNPAPDGTVSEGARFRIIEAMGRDERFYIDSVDRVEKLDLTGIRLVLRIAGAMFFQLEHTWSRAEGATHYTSVMDVGSRSPLGLPINAYLRSRIFVPGMERAWLRHNIEEVGRFEHFLPDLYRSRRDADLAAEPNGIARA